MSQQEQCHLCITIDTERDGGPFRLSRACHALFRNVVWGIAERLHPTLRKYGAVPTYLVDWWVLRNAEAMNALISLPGTYEIGAHLHADRVPAERDAEDNTRRGAFSCCDISDEVEAAKLRVLTEAVEETTGRRPTSFRAGRFGADAATIRALAQLGYKVDSSVTPGISWKAKGGPDFRSAPHQPYWVDPGDITRPGAGPILEVPISIGSKKSALLPNHWFFYDWLRPSNTSARRMIRLMQQTVVEDQPDTPIVFNMMFHSQELIGGASPYAWTERGARKLLGRVEAVVAHCREQGIEFVSLSEVYDLFAPRSLPAKAIVQHV